MNKSYNSLHIINKKAKIYSNKQDKISKLRSSALYQTKYNALLNWINKTDKIELHYINNKEYYCFYHNDYSFHIPKQKLNTNIEYQNKKVLHQFQSTHSLHNTNYQTEKESLIKLYNKHNLNPNQHLPNNTNFNAYWPYLPM